MRIENLNSPTPVYYLLKKIQIAISKNGKTGDKNKKRQILGMGFRGEGVGIFRRE